MTEPRIPKSCRYCGNRRREHIVKPGWHEPWDLHHQFACGTQTAPVIDSSTGDGMWWSISDTCAERLLAKYQRAKAK